MTARAIDTSWEREFVRLGGDNRQVSFLRSRYGSEVEIDTIGSDCVDFAKHKPVTSITGLLVSRVRDAAMRATRTPAPASPAERMAIAARGAAFAVQLYQLISEQGMRPDQIADQLEQACREGIQINRLVIDRLRALDRRWPGQP